MTCGCVGADYSCGFFAFVASRYTRVQRFALTTKDLLEYVIVHEMVHLIEPTHSNRFMAILGEHYPTWREARAELNELPLAAETWKE